MVYLLLLMVVHDMQNGMKLDSYHNRSNLLLLHKHHMNHDYVHLNMAFTYGTVHKKLSPLRGREEGTKN